MNRPHTQLTGADMMAIGGHIITANFGGAVFLRCVAHNSQIVWRRVDDLPLDQVQREAYLYRDGRSARRALRRMARGARGGLTEYNLEARTKITPIRKLLTAAGTIDPEKWPAAITPGEEA